MEVSWIYIVCDGELLWQLVRLTFDLVVHFISFLPIIFVNCFYLIFKCFKYLIKLKSVLITIFIHTWSDNKVSPYCSNKKTSQITKYILSFKVIFHGMH